MLSASLTFNDSSFTWVLGTAGLGSRLATMGFRASFFSLSLSSLSYWAIMPMKALTPGFDVSALNCFSLRTSLNLAFASSCFCFSSSSLTGYLGFKSPLKPHGVGFFSSFTDSFFVEIASFEGSGFTCNLPVPRPLPYQSLFLAGCGLGAGTDFSFFVCTSRRNFSASGS